MQSQGGQTSCIMGDVQMAKCLALPCSQVPLSRGVSWDGLKMRPTPHIWSAS